VTTAGCIDPGTVTPESLLAFVDGDAPPEVARHVAACPACSEEAASLASLQRRLGEALYRFDCPSGQSLGEYALDLLAPEARTAVARHVVDCLRCTAELRTLREFLAGDDPPVLERGGVLAGLRRIVATLLAPAPAMAPAAVALRGGSTSAQTYRAGDLTLTLGPGPQPRRGRASLMGLVVREDGDLEVPPASTARLLAPSGAAEATEIDDLGNFAFDDLAPATYSLELQLGDTVVVVEDVPVSS
jgi:anti-sigma factor RsiW